MHQLTSQILSFELRSHISMVDNDLVVTGFGIRDVGNRLLFVIELIDEFKVALVFFDAMVELHNLILIQPIGSDQLEFRDLGFEELIVR